VTMKIERHDSCDAQNDSYDRTSWLLCNLGQMCREDRQTVKEGTPEARTLPYLGLEHIEGQSGRILRTPAKTPMDAGRGLSFRFDTRHVLYGKLRPYLNKVVVPDFNGRCTKEAIPLLPEPGVERDYLAWLLRRPETVAWVMREKTGSRMPRADIDHLFRLNVRLPAIDEQRRIVTLLNRQMALVEHARMAVKEQHDIIDRLPSTLLHYAFRGAV